MSKLTSEELKTRNAAQRRQWRLANPERARAAGKRAYARRRVAHPEWNRKNALQSHVRNPWTKSICGARKRARERGLDFSLTREWAISQYTGRCAMTGLDFVLNNGRGKAGPDPRAPSIDRVDPQLGYVPSNCRFVLHAVNMFKSTLTDDDLLPIAAAFVAHQSFNSI